MQRRKVICLRNAENWNALLLALLLHPLHYTSSCTRTKSRDKYMPTPSSSTSTPTIALPLHRSNGMANFEIGTEFIFHLLYFLGFAKTAGYDFWIINQRSNINLSCTNIRPPTALLSCILIRKVSLLLPGWGSPCHSCWRALIQFNWPGCSC